MAKDEFAHTTKNGLGEREDWWTLHIDEATGQMLVQHDWDHVNAYLAKVRTKGTRQWSVEEFLHSDADMLIKHQLIRALARHGRS